MSVGFRNMSTFNILKNPHEAHTRLYIIAIWYAQGFIEIIIHHWISVGVWLQRLKTNMIVHLTSDFVLNDKVLQEVVSKEPILKIVIYMNINGVCLY